MDKYISQLADPIMAETFQRTVNILKYETNCSDSRIQFNLSFPQSRISKDFVQHESTLGSQLDKEKNDIKTEYNSNPIGPYMGPYDQSDCIPLKAQLSDSTLDIYNIFQCNNTRIDPKENCFLIKGSFQIQLHQKLIIKCGFFLIESAL